MENIKVSDLKDKSYFDAPVFLDSEYILLSPDTKASADLISRLRRWDYTQVYSDGEPKDTPDYISSDEGGMATAVLDIKEKQNYEDAKKHYYSLLNFIKEIFTVIKDTNSMDLSVITDRIKKLIDVVKSNQDAILRYQEFYYPSDNYLFMHSINTTILSLCIGDLMKLTPHRMIDLGIASMLHDIGMLKIPEQIYLSSKELAPKEKQMIKAHTVLGYRLLKNLSVSDDISLSALEHHERLNGTGYPRGLKGDKIILNARIIGAACSYDSNTTSRSYKDSTDGHNALLDLLKNRQELYDENVIRALIYSISLYPLGTLVVLSNNAIARVVRINHENPKTPSVHILIDPDGNKDTDQRIIKTGESDGITILRGMTNEEMKEMKQKYAG